MARRPAPPETPLEFGDGSPAECHRGHKNGGDWRRLVVFLQSCSL